MSNLGEALTPEEIQVRNCNWKTNLKISIQTMIDEADADGDGQINYEEFYSMMNC